MTRIGIAPRVEDGDYRFPRHLRGGLPALPAIDGRTIACRPCRTIDSSGGLLSSAAHALRSRKRRAPPARAAAAAPSTARLTAGFTAADARGCATRTRGPTRIAQILERCANGSARAQSFSTHASNNAWHNRGATAAGSGLQARKLEVAHVHDRGPLAHARRLMRRAAPRELSAPDRHGSRDRVLDRARPPRISIKRPMASSPLRVFGPAESIFGLQIEVKHPAA